MASTTFEDWHAIHGLLVRYLTAVDDGRFDDMAGMFADATYRVAHADGDTVSTYRGVEQVRNFCSQVKIHPDGTPRTRHLVTNVHIEVDGDEAEATSAVVVLQQTERLPLQPIATGRYRDRLVRRAQAWQFADRLVYGFLLGDRSDHVLWHAGVPDPGDG